MCFIGKYNKFFIMENDKTNESKVLEVSKFLDENKKLQGTLIQGRDLMSWYIENVKSCGVEEFVDHLYCKVLNNSFNYVERVEWSCFNSLTGFNEDDSKFMLEKLRKYGRELTVEELQRIKGLMMIKLEDNVKNMTGEASDDDYKNRNRITRTQKRYMEQDLEEVWDMIMIPQEIVKYYQYGIYPIVKNK